MGAEKPEEFDVLRLVDIADEVLRVKRLTTCAQMAVTAIEDDNHRKALDWILDIIHGGLETVTDMLRRQGVVFDGE